jgi:hypothetical protein
MSNYSAHRSRDRKGAIVYAAPLRSWLSGQKTYRMETIAPPPESEQEITHFELLDGR